MSLQKINCPECGAGLKSAAGFKVGKTVNCPKCETPFVVEDPDEAEPEEEARPKPAKKAVKAVVADEEDEEEEERPKKKKKKKRAAEDDEERSYKNSPLRFVILGVLVLVMLVLGFMLYQKRKNEGEAVAVEPAPAPTDPQAVVRPNIAPPKIDPGKLPKDGPKRPTKGGGAKGPDVGAVAGGAVGDLLGGGPAAPAEAPKLLKKYTAALVGTWTADLGGGASEQLVYGADGTFRAARTGPGAATASGTYSVKGLVGTKGLKLQLDGPEGARTAIAVFDADELEHPSLEKGVVATFRKSK